MGIRFDNIADEILQESFNRGAAVTEGVNRVEASGVDIQKGAPFGVRAKTALKLTAAGKKHFVESVYGEGNVRHGITGNLEFKNPKTNQWTQFDEENVGLADIADAAGVALEALPPLITGMFTGGVLPAVVAGGLSQAGMQGISAALPGDDEISPLERGARVGIAGGLSGAAQGASNLLFSGVDLVRPRNLLARFVNPKKKVLQMGGEAATTQRALTAEGERLAAESGVDLTSAGLTGSRKANSLESFLRQHPATMDTVFEGDVRRIGQLERFFNKVVDDIKAPEEVLGSANAGARVVKAHEMNVRNLVKTRAKQANVNFGRVKALSGDAEIIEIPNTIAVIDELVKDHQSTVATNSGNSIVNHLKNLKTQLVKKTEAKASNILDQSGRPASITPATSTPKKLKAIDFKNSLSQTGEVANGTGNFIKNLQDNSIDRYLAGRVNDALQADLELAIEKGGLPGEVMDALRLARDNYRIHSEGINKAADAVFAKATGLIDESGFGGEKVIKKILGAEWTETQIKNAVNIAGKIDPASVKGIKRAVLEDIFDSASTAGGSQKIGAPALSPRKLATALEKHAKKLKALYQGDAQGLQAVNTLKNTSKRLSDVALQGSQTKPLGMVEDFINDVVGPVAGLIARPMTAPVRAPGVAAEVAVNLSKIMTPKALARILTNPEGANEAIKLIATKKWTKASAAALAKILTIDEREKAMEDF